MGWCILAWNDSTGCHGYDMSLWPNPDVVGWCIQAWNDSTGCHGYDVSLCPNPNVVGQCIQAWNESRLVAMVMMCHYDPTLM